MEDFHSTHPIYTSKALAYILHYKWFKYAKYAYWLEAFLFFVIFFCVTINSVHIFPERMENLTNGLPDYRIAENYVSIALDLIIFLFTSFFAKEELH